MLLNSAFRLTTTLVYVFSVLASPSDSEAQLDARLGQGLASSLACTELRRSLGSSKVQSSGAQYNATAAGTWSLFNYDSPTCIVYASNANDVKRAMQVIFRMNARYGVRAGGHSPMIGWNNLDDGVLIDFSHMKAIGYDSKTDTISLEPGVRWGEAVEYLEKFGVAPVGGRASDVGTGLLLGGGLSFLSPSHGYACDSFKALDVVLVDGTLVTATATNKYSDLFRALKGGANRFGIVTRYQLYPAHTGTRNEKNFFGGLVQYPSSSTDTLLHATANYIKNVQDPKAVIGVILGATAPSDTANAAFLFYQGSSLPESIFGELLAVPSNMSILAPMSYYDIIQFGGPGAGYGLGQQNSGSALIEEKEFKNALTSYQNFSATFKDQVEQAVMIITPVPASQIAKGVERGGNIIQPPRAHGSIAFSDTYKEGVKKLSAQVEAGRQLVIKQVPPSSGLPLFANESDKKQDIFKRYGRYEELKRTYKKYDPSSFNIKHQEGPILKV